LNAGIIADDNINPKNNPSIEVRHYGTKENTYLLYNDDGESYDYEKGEFSLTELKVERKKDGELVGKSKSLNNTEFNYGKITWRWMQQDH
jgi:alpha-D-xyloside xylohydrolase